MAYGFDESKSKVEVVDKATQDAKDASQDTSIANKAVSSVGVAVDDSNNLTVTVAQADGTSKSGSVALPAGGEIEVEELVSKMESMTRTVTFDSAFTIALSSSNSASFNTYKIDEVVDTHGLYYDSNNNIFKECITKHQTAVASGTVSTSKYNNSLATDMASSHVIYKAFSFLIGMSGTSTSYSFDQWYACFRYNNIVLQVKVKLSGSEITGIDGVTVCSSSSSVSIPAGTYEMQWVRRTANEGMYTIPNDSSAPIVPSTYTKIADL